MDDKQNHLKLTAEDDNLIANVYSDGDHAFHSQDLEEVNVTDAQEWLDNGELVGLVSELHGGIIGYVNRDFADQITTVLNLHLIERENRKPE